MSDHRGTPSTQKYKSPSPVKLKEQTGACKYTTLEPLRVNRLFVAPNMKDFIVIDKELMKGLSEKEVELEHLKTVIVGLNEKLKVKEDIEEDLYNIQI